MVEEPRYIFDGLAGVAPQLRSRCPLRSSSRTLVVLEVAQVLVASPTLVCRYSRAVIRLGASP